MILFLIQIAHIFSFLVLRQRLPLVLRFTHLAAGRLVETFLSAESSFKFDTPYTHDVVDVSNRITAHTQNHKNNVNTVIILALNITFFILFSWF